MRLEPGPIVTGLLGGLLAAGLSRLLRNQLPRGVNGKSVAELIATYRGHYRFCGGVFISSLVTAMLFFQRNWVASNDWRVLALAFGGGAIAPLALVYLWMRLRGDGSFQEMWVAFAAQDGYPPWLMNTAMIVGAALLFMAVGGYIFGKG
jgi:hypothetical protein